MARAKKDDSAVPDAPGNQANADKDAGDAGSSKRVVEPVDAGNTAKETEAQVEAGLNIHQPGGEADEGFTEPPANDESEEQRAPDGSRRGTLTEGTDLENPKDGTGNSTVV